MEGLARRLTILAFAFALLPAMSAMAASGWLPSLPVSDSDYGSSHDVAMDSAGNVFAVWRASQPGSNEVMFSMRPAGGGFSTPQPLTAAGVAGFNPQIAVNSRGDAIATWTFQDRGADTQGVQAAFRPAGGSFGPAEDVVSTGLSPFSGQIGFPAIDGDGDAVIAMRSVQGGSFVAESVSVAYGEAASGAYELTPLSGFIGSTGQVPGVAMNSRGDAVMSFLAPDSDTGNKFVIWAGIRPAGESSLWDEEELASTSPSTTDMPVAIDDAGDVNLLWITSGGLLMNEQRPADPDFAGGTWSASPQQASEQGDSVETPALVSNGRGDTIAVWRAGSGTPGIDAAVGTAGGSFASPVTIDSSGKAFEPAAALDPAGNGLVAWRLEGAVNRVQARSRPAGGRFADVVSVSPEGEHAAAPLLAMDGEGNGVALWHKCNTNGLDCTDDGTEQHGVRAAGWDAVAPRFTSVSIPPSGTAGSPLDLSASVFDVWGAEVSWSYGDGGGATGTNVSHTYAGPGIFPVSATATDGVGNSASAGGTIDVAAAPVEPPPIEPPPTGPQPTLKVDANADPVSGSVFVSVPNARGGSARLRGRGTIAQRRKRPRGYSPFIRLEEAALVPIGSIFDTAKGRVDLTTATTTPGVNQTGRFSRGEFKLGQNATGLTTLTMRGLSLAGCSRNVRKGGARAAARRIRRLSGSARGRFRTRGRHSSATVRGTVWSVQDSCKGTLTTVREGSVTVRDFRKRRNVVVRAGRRYLARPR
jgi:hypothetical protein